ncbi:Thiolase, N-terminal domain-containing protein [Stachybotrys elegans]|uniref:acetyl-CoA C-acyltransferase n=1 Tax=Stachybotrys elegans TaxID=80388 RepID=A0A8K0WN04_9HYPO|nr:Thiolase, N-terminal domain-containing protein [Stachybotrys elegans]
MAPNSETEMQPNGTKHDTTTTIASPDMEPATPPPQDIILPDSQITLPSTEIPSIPLDPNESFAATELNDDRAEDIVIPSSVTPPSTQAIAPNGVGRQVFPNSQLSTFVSPPATIPNDPRDKRLKDVGAGFEAPTPIKILEASPEELRAMVQSCVAEQQRLKMETAHYRLQLNLVSMQAAEDQNRALVEQEMMRREVEALRMVEHSRQAKRELSAPSETYHIKYIQVKQSLQEALEDNRVLQHRLHVAKKVIQQKEEENVTLVEENNVMLNRIRENRERLHSMCSPGGLFHGALTPKQTAESRGHGLSALLQAIQDNSPSNNNNSAPSTPISAHRPAPRQVGKHHRNAQSMSSLPTTPLNRPRGEHAVLLPSVDLVPQSEPQRYSHKTFVPINQDPKRSQRRSRESTISAEDNEELARQAIQSAAAAAQSFVSRGSKTSQASGSSQRAAPGEEEEEEVFDSQASQAARELLRRDARQSFEMKNRDASPAPAEKSAKLQTKILAGGKEGGGEKRKFSGGRASGEEEMRRRPPSMAVPIAKSASSLLAKLPTDVVILSSLRTPITRSYKGRLKDAYPEELLASVLRATLDAHPGLDPAAVQDVAVGVVLSELGGSKAARMALNHVGYPNSTSLYTVNRACSSSLQAIALVAAQIRTGMVDVGVGAGMESMTRNYGSRAIPVDLWPDLRESPNRHARDCIMPMGLTSENVARRYGVSRADQDAFALESHVRAARARAAGSFADEIVPVTTRFQEVDRQGAPVGEPQTVTVTQDDGIRDTISPEALAKLKPAFAADGASTAGNSSQVSDGAAATLLMRRSTATELGLADRIMGKFASAVTVGCDPDEMGIGPALAIPRLLTQHGLVNADIHRWEINEAFASQAIHCVRDLGLEDAWVDGKVNPDGGAIALGHPLGATGARMTSTLMHGLRRDGGELGVVSMCVGTGMGMAGLFVRE